MKKTYFLLITIFIISVVLNIYLFVNNNKFINIIDKYRNSILTREWNIQINHGEVINDITLLNDSSAISLKDLFQNDHFMIVRVPKGACKTCVDKIIPCLERYPQEINPENYLYLIDSDILNDIKIFAKTYDVPVSSVKISKDSINLAFDKANMVYAIVLDRELRIKYFFIPSMNDLSYNTSSLHFIKSNYF